MKWNLCIEGEYRIVDSRFTHRTQYNTWYILIAIVFSFNIECAQCVNTMFIFFLRMIFKHEHETGFFCRARLGYSEESNTKRNKQTFKYQNHMHKHHRYQIACLATKKHTNKQTKLCQFTALAAWLGFSYFLNNAVFNPMDFRLGLAVWI